MPQGLLEQLCRHANVRHPALKPLVCCFSRWEEVLCCHNYVLLGLGSLSSLQSSNLQLQSLAVMDGLEGERGGRWSGWSNGSNKSEIMSRLPLHHPTTFQQISIGLEMATPALIWKFGASFAATGSRLPPASSWGDRPLLICFPLSGAFVLFQSQLVHLAHMRSKLACLLPRSIHG